MEEPKQLASSPEENHNQLEAGNAMSPVRGTKRHLGTNGDDLQRDFQSEKKGSTVKRAKQLMPEPADIHVDTKRSAAEGEVVEYYKSEDASAYEEWQMQRQQYPDKTATEHSSSLSLSGGMKTSDMGLFARLPAELRNRIYRMALVEESGVYVVRCPLYGCNQKRCSHTKLSTAVPGLLTSCRQVRHEGMPMFCTQNIMRFDSEAVIGACTARWLRSLGPVACFLRTIELDVDIWKLNRTRGSMYGLQTHQVELKCPSADGQKFSVHFKFDLDCLEEEVLMVMAYLEKINGKMGKQTTEQLLLDFVSCGALTRLIARAKSRGASKLR